MSPVELSAMNNAMSDDEEAFIGEEDALMGKNSTENSTKEEDASMEEKTSKWFFLCMLILFFVYIPITIWGVSRAAMMETKIYIQDVYIPALDTYTSAGPPFNASIIVDLMYHREVATEIDDHEELHFSVYYSHGTNPVAVYTIEAFSMGENQTTVHKIAAMEAPELPWEEAFRAVSTGSRVELVVWLGKLRSRCPYAVAHGYAWSARVAVDASGHMVPEGPVGFSYDDY